MKLFISGKKAFWWGAAWCCLNILSSVNAQDTPVQNESHFIWLPGSARAISRTESASRDAPVFEYGYGPVAQSSIGGEWGWFTLKNEQTSIRVGMYAMMGMENHNEQALFPPFQLWRGMTGFLWGWSFDALAKRWFGAGGGCELGLVLGHESDHGDMEDPRKPGDISGGGGGDFAEPDIAFRFTAGTAWVFTARVQSRLYFYGSLSAAPGIDCVVKWRILPGMNPVIAFFGEGLSPREKNETAGYFIRIMPGLVFPGKIGQFTFFLSLDNGNGKGLRINHKETRYSFGIRYAPFSR
jgi:hypothetical protein